jgi:hypothetical protein
MYIAPRKYPSSRSNFNPHAGHRSCIPGNSHTDLRKILPERQRGQSARKIPRIADTSARCMHEV